MPVITFSSTSVTLIIPEDAAIIQTSSSFISSCAVTPALPLGLHLDPFSCSIYGRPFEASTQSSYSITPTNAKGSGTARTVTITIVDCADSSKHYVEALFYTGTVPSEENNRIGFALTETSSDPANKILENLENSTTEFKRDTLFRFVVCAKPGKFRLDLMGSRTDPWTDAYVEIFVLGKQIGEQYKHTRSQSQTAVEINPSVLFSPIRSYKVKIPTVDEDQSEFPFYEYNNLTVTAVSKAQVNLTSKQNVAFIYTEETYSPTVTNIPGYKLLLTHYSGVILYVNKKEYYRRFIQEYFVDNIL